MFYMIAYTIRYDEEIYEEKFTNADDMRDYYEESGYRVRACLAF